MSRVGTPFEDSPEFVQSLARGLEVIRSFDEIHTTSNLSELASRTGLARAVVRRSLLTLEHLGYVGRKGRLFYLTPRVLELGFSYLSSLALPEVALPVMEDLAQHVGESSSLSVLDDTDIVYVARVPVRRVMTVSLGVGARLPAYAASMGRVLLAGLSDEHLEKWLGHNSFRRLTPHTLHDAPELEREIKRVRVQGYCLVLQELELGLCSIAVPVRNGRGRTLAALNVGMPFQRGVRERAMREILPALRKAGRSIEAALAASGAVIEAES